MFRKIVLGHVLTTLFFTCFALAETSDFNILIGVYTPSFSAGTQPALMSSSTGASVQFSYGHQLLGFKSGALELDIPLTIATHQNETFGNGFSTSTKANVFFTPAVRYRFVPHSRVSPFAILGGGVGSFGSIDTNAGPGLQVNMERKASPVLAFGFGTDVRLTRLLSVRGEVRDFVSRAGLGGTEGRNHPVFGIGIGFHFR